MDDSKPVYFKDVKPNNKRRAPWHDYKSRLIYMITVNKAPSSPSWGSLDMQTTNITLTANGKIILEELLSTPVFHPEIRILSNVIMPDHLHVLLFVTKTLDKHIGAIMQAVKSAATRRIRKKGRQC